MNSAIDSTTADAETTTADASLDAIWGAEAIGAFINKPTRATFHLLERGLLPAQKVGNQWVSSRRALRKRLTGEAVA